MRYRAKSILRSTVEEAMKRSTATTAATRAAAALAAITVLAAGSLLVSGPANASPKGSHSKPVRVEAPKTVHENSRHDDGREGRGGNDRNDRNDRKDRNEGHDGHESHGSSSTQADCDDHVTPVPVTTPVPTEPPIVLPAG